MTSDSTRPPAARPAGADATLITVAPTGAESQKAAVPALPVTLEELVTTAKDCAAAGAAVIHVHIRDDDAQPTLDIGRLNDTVHALRESTDLIVQLSTGGAVTDSFDRRLAVLDAGAGRLLADLRHRQLRDEVFLIPGPSSASCTPRRRNSAVVPEFELFDLGHVATLHRLLDELGAPHGGHVHCDLVMGVPGGMPGDAATLVQAVAALPDGATWSATGIGRTSVPVMFAALAAGGHLRVGMEDTVSFARGRPVTGNAELVERAATLAGLAQRPAMTPPDARIDAGGARSRLRILSWPRSSGRASPSPGTGAPSPRCAADGSVQLPLGSAGEPMFPRSSNKPMQAAAMLRSGLDLPGKLLALAAASHSGEDFHVAGVREILAGAGLAAVALQCPPDLPLDEAARRAVLRGGGGPDRVHMNCSGKHAAMLATCVADGWPTASYRSPDHPLQQEIRRVDRRAGGRAGDRGRRRWVRRAADGHLGDRPGAGVPRGRAGRAGLGRAQGRRRDARLPRLELRDARQERAADGAPCPACC